jgi:hypothetical protein
LFTKLPGPQSRASWKLANLTLKTLNLSKTFLLPRKCARADEGSEPRTSVATVVAEGLAKVLIHHTGGAAMEDGDAIKVHACPPWLGFWVQGVWFGARTAYSCPVCLSVCLRGT